MPSPGNIPGQQFRLVKAALPALPPIQWHWHNCIKWLIDRNRALEESRQWPAQRAHTAVFEKVNQVSEGAFIETETGRAIEATQALAACGANAVLVKRIAVYEGCMTASAEVIGLEGFRCGQTLVANGNSGPFCKRALADAAFVGKKQRKNAVGDRSEGGSSRSRYATTREGAPPDIKPALRRLSSEIS